MRAVPGFAIDDDNRVTFGHARRIDPELTPLIHRSANLAPRGGGALSYLTGDLMNPDVCPGPFDAIIERRTVQLFPEDQRIPAFERLVGRLAENAVLVSHQHHGGRRPGEERDDDAGEWLRSRGFVTVYRSTSESAPRLAWLICSSG